MYIKVPIKGLMAKSVILDILPILKCIDSWLCELMPNETAVRGQYIGSDISIKSLKRKT
jgi:hypothetical protein